MFPELIICYNDLPYRELTVSLKCINMASQFASVGGDMHAPTYTVTPLTR